jgi:hypothetical protein
VTAPRYGVQTVATFRQVAGRGGATMIACVAVSLPVASYPS